YRGDGSAVSLPQSIVGKRHCRLLRLLRILRLDRFDANEFDITPSRTRGEVWGGVKNSRLLQGLPYTIKILGGFQPPGFSG
ncbi:hypothetical protein, partial [Microcoleus sp. herbarium13]|uniref:hypothetical protein n=1 Tax=Microcoleus sp. herbarium13 TaxID=3055438 RepID=UPI002FD1C337